MEKLSQYEAFFWSLQPPFLDIRQKIFLIFITRLSFFIFLRGAIGILFCFNLTFGMYKGENKDCIWGEKKNTRTIKQKTL